VCRSTTRGAKEEEVWSYGYKVVPRVRERGEKEVGWRFFCSISFERTLALPIITSNSPPKIENENRINKIQRVRAEKKNPPPPKICQISPTPIAARRPKPQEAYK
jgi:hypothetical protein